MKKRVLSMFMALALCLTLLPTAAFAEGEDVSISGGVIGGGETGGEGGGIYVAPGSPTEGGGGTYIPREDTQTEIWCVGKPDSIGRGYDGTTDGGTIPIDLTFTDGTNEIKLKEGTGFTAKKTFDSADAGWHTVTVEIALIGEAAAKYKLKAGEGTFTIGGNINKAYPDLTVSLSKTACTAGEKLLPLLSVKGAPEDAEVTYYYAPINSGYLEFEGSEAVPKIDENTAISEPGTYYVYAKSGETKNYEEERSATVALTVTEPAAASVSKADGTDGGTYKTLPAALNAAQDGDTVKLLANHTTNWGDVEAGEYATLAVVRKTLTLDLNGMTVDYLTVGEVVPDEEGGILDSYNGNLTVVDNIQGDSCGKIKNLEFVKGSLAIQGGRIGDSDGSNLTCDGSSGTVTISGGTVCNVTVGDGAAVTVTGGSGHCGTWQAGRAAVTVTGGAFGDVTFANPRNVQLTGGSFEKIAVSGASAVSLSALLANGYAFYSTSGAYQSAEGTELSNVQVQRHTHAIGENGKCTECGAAFGASVTVRGGGASDASYYDTIDSAFTAAHKGDTVTLLADITNRGGDDIFVSGGPYTLDLNGHRIEAGINLVVGDMDNSEALLRGELTVKDSSTDNAGYVQYLKLWNGDLTVESGSFHWIIETGSDSVGTITIKGGTADEVKHTCAGVMFRLSGGTFDYVENIVGGKAGDLLAAGYAYAKKDNPNVIENGYAAGYSAVSNVTVVKHDHTWNDGVCACGVSCAHIEMNSTTGKCSVCGKLLAVASVTKDSTTTYFDDIHAAFGGAESSSGSTLTLLQDVTLADGADIYIRPDSGDYRFTVDWNGHTLSGNTWRSLLTFSGSTSVTLTDSSEAKTGGVCNNGMGAAVYLSIGGSNSVEITGGTYSPLVTTDEGCYGTVRISGGVFKNPEGSGQSTALYVAKGGKLAALLADGVTLANDESGTNLLDVYSRSTTGHGTFYVVAHTHTIGESTNKCACGYTCSHTAVDTDGKCTVCKKPMAAMVTKGGESRAYAALNDALSAADGGTVKLLADAGGITISSPLKLDLNGKTAEKLTVTGDVTLASLLPEGYAFKSGSTWISDLSSTELTNVSMAKIPIKSMDYPTEMSMTYGGMGTLLVKVEKETGTGTVSFQWYKVEDGKTTAVGSATAKNQFDLSTQKLSAGQHTFRFSVTCDGYEKMSQDIVVTVERASIGANRITPPTAQENLTYNGQEQALITAGSVTSGGAMQYSLAENGTYSQGIPTGTDAGAYTVWYRVIGDENHNDTAPASVAVRIGQKPLTITGVTAASKTYDGTKTAGITSVIFDGVNLNRGTDYTVAASFDDAGVGNVKNVTATVTLMEQTAKNYALEQSSFNTTGSITKAAVPDFTKKTALVIVNGHEKTYTVTLPALPKLETPKEYGALTYEIGEIKLNDGYYTSGAKVENGALTLPIQKNDVETTGPVGTVTVVIKSTNYEDITLTVNVNATNKLIPTVTAPTANALTYNGSEQALVTAGKTTGGTMLYRLDDSEWSEQIPTAKNAGEYTVWYKVQGDAEYADVAEQNVTVTASKKAVTVTALNQSAHTGSTAPDLSSPKADKDYKVEGLVGADTLSGTVTLTYAQTPDMSKPGKTAINIAGTLSNDNYEITYVPGTLTVSNQPSSGGGSSSGGSSSGGGSSSSDRDTSSSGTVKTETTKNNDGSVTKTETKKDGTKVETTTGKDGSTVKTTTNPNGSSVTETKAADGSTGTVKTDKNGQTTAETALSSKAIEDAKKSGEAVKAPVEVKASRDSSTAPTVEVELPKNSGDTKVEIPVSNVKPGTVAVLVHADGTEEIVKNSLPTEDGIQLTINGGATVKIVDNSKNFADTRNHWAKDAIDFVSARGLVNGMSTTIYAPNASTTRAQLWTILARQNDADLTGGSIWYEKAQNWAKEKGISDGMNPNGTINRAQMVTMLWRAMGQPAAASGASFADVPADSYYAQAVAWAIENGITAGVGGGRFDPNSTCTRGQIATFLYRYMK